MHSSNASDKGRRSMASIVVNTSVGREGASTSNTPRHERLESIGCWERRKVITLYLITITILFADMNLLAPNLSIVAEEFGMDDDERDLKLGGLLAFGFFIVGAPISYIIGWMADHYNRSPLFAATIFFGEIGCLFTVFVHTYWQLYICRVMTGVSIGSALPIVYSLLGDLYTANQRPTIAAFVSTGSGLGMGIGQIIAGSLDSWRLPFLIVAIPGMLCAILLLFVKDPVRGGMEAAYLETQRHRNIRDEEVSSRLSASESSEGIATYISNVTSNNVLQNCGMNCLESGSQIEHQERKSDGCDTKNTDNENTLSSSIVSCKGNDTVTLLKTPSVLLTILQAAPGAIPFGFAATFLNDFLQEQRGLTKEEATGVLVTFGVGNALGVIFGGFLGHFTYKRDVRGPPFVMGISLLLGCIPFYFLTNYIDESASATLVAGVTVLSGLLVVIPVPLERSILSNVCLPKLRGQANALVSIVDELGKGLGPALVSLIITTSDRETAFNISLIGWIIGGVLSLAICLFVAKDEEAVQQQLREEMAHEELEWV